MSWFKIEVIVAMGVYAFIISLFLLGRWKAKQKEKNKSANSKERSVTVIIPFRDEENNLKRLITSIEALSAHADEYVFINDHSKDDSVEVLKHLSIPHRILGLKEETGKKKAIALGVENANSDYIITWDADVVVPKNYFLELGKSALSDLVILPVKMLGPDFIPGFFAMDYQLQTQANVSIAGFYRPISASGANLLFKKTVFLEMESARNDQSISSGDDQFFLKACLENGKEVSLLSNKNLLVETTAPDSVSSGLQQRFRWLGKTKKVGDSFATVFGLFALFIQLSYYSFAWYQTAIGDWGATILMILIKGESDAFLATYKFQEQFNTLKVFLYELIYPAYIITLVFGTPFTKTKWKDREVN